MNFRAAALVASVCGQVGRVIFNDYEGARRATDLALSLQDGALAIAYQATLRVHGAIAELRAGGDLEAIEARIAPCASRSRRGRRCAPSSGARARAVRRGARRRAG
ncbi:MAG: hypothetical protein H6719_16920 [Sandaracinaceae bacterium]|nr:hypothetical protein [Sandaracinaceae bacterium]